MRQCDRNKEQYRSRVIQREATHADRRDVLAIRSVAYGQPVWQTVAAFPDREEWWVRDVIFYRSWLSVGTGPEFIQESWREA